MSLPRVPVRERCLEYLKGLFLGATQVGGENLTWQAVTRAPLTQKDREFKTRVSIMEGAERKRELSGRTERVLSLSVEFEIATFFGEEPSIFLNNVLTSIQLLVNGDVTLGANCLHIYETRNETDISSDAALVVGGIIFFEMTYRHVYLDPTRAIGE